MGFLLVFLYLTFSCTKKGVNEQQELDGSLNTNDETPKNSEHLEDQQSIKEREDNKVDLDEKLIDLPINKSKPIILMITGSFNPPQPSHLQILNKCYLYLIKSGFKVNKSIIMPSSYKHYLLKFKAKSTSYNSGNYSEKPRLLLTNEDRIHLLNQLKDRMEKAKTLNSEFCKTLEVSDFDIRSSEKENKFLDYPIIYHKYELEYKNFNIIYIGGSDLLKNGRSDITYTIVVPRNSKSDLSSTKLMNGDKKTLSRIKTESPGYLTDIKELAKKSEYKNYSKLPF